MDNPPLRNKANEMVCNYSMLCGSNRLHFFVFLFSHCSDVFHEDSQNDSLIKSLFARCSEHLQLMPREVAWCDPLSCVTMLCFLL